MKAKLRRGLKPILSGLKRAAADLPVILPLAAGAIGIAVGAYLIYAPAGFIVGGCLCIALGLINLRGGEDGEHR